MNLSDAVAIVTGGASGLGRATAEMVLGRGGQVVLVDLPSSDGAAVAGGMGERAVFVPTDVTDADAVTEAVATATAMGPLRVAVNCAGIGSAGRVVGRDGAMPLEDFSKVVAVNLIGTFNVIRLAAEAMIVTEPVGEPDSQERGVIVNTASIAAYDGQIGQSAYAASKGGNRGDDPPTGPRPVPQPRPRVHHCPRAVRDPTAGRAPSGGPGLPRRVDPDAVPPGAPG